MSRNHRLLRLYRKGNRFTAGKSGPELNSRDTKAPLECYLVNCSIPMQIFFACLATFSTTGASAIGYAYAAEIPTQRLRARTAAWSLAMSNLVGIMFSFCTPLMINGTSKWGVKTGFL